MFGDMHSNRFNPPSHTDPTYAQWMSCHGSIESEGQSHTPHMPIPDSTTAIATKVPINIQKKTKHSYIFFTLECNCSVNRCRDRASYIYLHCYIVPTLFAYSLACHPYSYILLHFIYLLAYSFNVNLGYS